VPETAEGAGSGGPGRGIGSGRGTGAGGGPGRGSSRMRRGGVTGASRKSHQGRIRDEDAWRSTLPCDFFRRYKLVAMVLGPYRGLNSCSAFQSPGNGPPKALVCDVPGVSRTSSSRIGAPGPHSRAEHPRSRTSSRTSATPCVPPRPGRLVAASACPGRHETPGTQLGRPLGPDGRHAPNATSDGRLGPEARRPDQANPAPLFLMAPPAP
jgi:hypothetical protein